MKNFIFVFVGTLLLIWFLTRRALWNHFLSSYFKNKKLMFIWDILFVGFHSVGYFYRINQSSWWNSFLGTWIGRSSYFFMGFCWLLALWAIFLEITSFINKKKSLTNKEKNDEFLENPSRRLLPQKALALGGLGVVSSVSAIGVYQGINPKIYEVDIPLSKKFPKLKGLTITQVSDLHIGPSLKSDFLKDVVFKANELQSDILVITGDIVDGTVSLLKDEMKSFSEFRAPLGVYYVTGNHEYYWGAKPWVQFVKDSGITPLMNSHQKLFYNEEPFYLAGVTDLQADRFLESHKSDPYKALPNDLDDICKILLAHRPKSCYEAVKTGAHLQLSGHTHGGQGIPWKFLVKLAQPYLAGLYNHKGMYLYVNRGIGFWGPPTRFGIQSEITKITIV